MSRAQQHHQGISLNDFAERTGIRKGQLLYYCRHGRIEGAVFVRALWQWRIFPPAKLVIGRLP